MHQKLVRWAASINDGTDRDAYIAGLQFTAPLCEAELILCNLGNLRSATEGPSEAATSENAVIKRILRLLNSLANKATARAKGDTQARLHALALCLSLSRVGEALIIHAKSEDTKTVMRQSLDAWRLLTATLCKGLKHQEVEKPGVALSAQDSFAAGLLRCAKLARRCSSRSLSLTISGFAR